MLLWTAEESVCRSRSERTAGPASWKLGYSPRYEPNQLRDAVWPQVSRSSVVSAVDNIGLTDALAVSRNSNIPRPFTLEVVQMAGQDRCLTRRYTNQQEVRDLRITPRIEVSFLHARIFVSLYHEPFVFDPRLLYGDLYISAYLYLHTSDFRIPSSIDKRYES